MSDEDEGKRDDTVGLFVPPKLPGEGDKPEGAKAEGAKAEPVKAEPVKAEPVKAEPVKEAASTPTPTPTTTPTTTSTTTTTSTSAAPGGAAGDEPGSRRKRRKRPDEVVEAVVVAETAAPAPAPAAKKAAVVAADLPAKAKAAASEAEAKGVASRPEGDGSTSDGGDRMDLPKWNRAKVKRKQPAGQPEEDAFQAGVRKAGRQAVRKAPVVFGLIVLVAAGIAIGVWYRGHRAEQDAEATRILASAAAVQARAEVKPPDFKYDRKLPFPIPLLDEEAERAQKVDKGLADLHDAAEGSDADKVADLMRAAQQVKDGKFTDAIATYTGFLEKNAEHDLAFLAREGKALALEANGDVEGALAELDTLAGKQGDFYRDQALGQKGRILEEAGRKDEALAVYEQYVEEFPLDQDSLAKPQVVERLRELKPELVPAEADAPAGGFELPPGLMP